MLDLFGSIKGLLKIDKICIDNHIFRLHYKVTVIILFAFSLLVTSYQFIGDPINCMVDHVPPKVMDSYCWIYSTFTLPNHVDGRVGKDVVYPGVSSHVAGEDDIKFHKYYQWVCIVLYFQALLFYFPRYVWKIWEDGRISVMVTDIDCPLVSDECKEDRKKMLIDYFTKNLHRHNLYAMRFFLCEFMNLVNVIAQAFFMDYFLDGEFSTYGLEVLRFTEMEPDNRKDPMARVFPKMTKCTFNKYGSSGSIQNFDGLCVLSINIVNEKIYVFLWFWFLLVTVISVLNMVYRITVLVMPKFRLLLLRARSRLAEQGEIEIIAKQCEIGDWFVLYQLAKNINPIIFKEFVSELAKEFDSKQTV